MVKNSQEMCERGEGEMVTGEGAERHHNSHKNHNGYKRSGLCHVTAWTELISNFLASILLHWAITPYTLLACLHLVRSSLFV
jgi:hypothetical protein